MQTWIKISLLLCSFGFFREFRPSEPFVVEFFAGEWRNLTVEEINRDVYPMGTYAYLSLVVIIFLITDIFRYKPIIIASALCGITMWSLMLWTTSKTALLVVQWFYGFFMASEVAYYTYMYAKVEKNKYQNVTGHTRSAVLSGKFVSGMLAQLLVSSQLLDFRELNYISFGSQCLSFVCACALPAVSASMYFYYTVDDSNMSQNSNNNIRRVESANEPSHIQELQIDTTTTNGAKLESSATNLHSKSIFSYNRAFALLWTHFKTSYSNKLIIMWSVWWALATSGMYQVDSYAQFIWQRIEPDQRNLYNGAAIAAVTLLGALSAFIVGTLNSKYFDRWDLWIITGCSALQGGLVLWIALTDNLIIAYVTYILFGTLYHFLITVASSAVAKNISNDCFGLVFGFNTFLSLAFQSVLTVFVVSDWLFTLTIQGQFLIYSFYFMGLTVIYGAVGIVSLCMKSRNLEEKL